MQARNNYMQNRRELELYQFALPEDVIDDFANIELILMDRDIILAQLSKLEQLLVEDCTLKGIFNSIESIRTLLNPRNHTQYKLLSDVLYTWAANNHINTEFYKINTLLDPSSFHSILKQGIFFKDVGVPAEHGAWTHFLQWFIIFEANKDNAFLNNSPYDLYKLTGSDESICTLEPKKSSIWFLCFDNHARNNPHDGRSPDNLLALIKSNPDSQLNLLSIILKKGFKNPLTLVNAGSAIDKRNQPGNNQALVLSRYCK